MSTRFGLAVLMGIVGLAGCRVDWQIIPPTRGRLTRDGAPVSGAHVTVSDLNGDAAPEEGCPSPLATATTNENGEFSLDEARRQTYWIPLPGDPGNAWRLCVLEKDTLVRSWDWSGLVHERETLELECDLTSDEMCTPIW